MREEAEQLFQEHRRRGGFEKARDRRTAPEEREALWEVKKRGDALWQQAAELVQAASESVLRSSQVRAAVLLACAPGILACWRACSCRQVAGCRRGQAVECSSRSRARVCQEVSLSVAYQQAGKSSC